MTLRKKAGVRLTVGAKGMRKIMTNATDIEEQLVERGREELRGRRLSKTGVQQNPGAPKHEEDQQKIAWDDASGAELDPKVVQEARRLEVEYVRSRNVYTKGRRKDVPSGGKVVKTKWVDINKGDLQEMNVRSRLVAMEFKDGDDPDLFAGTPPLEALRLLCSMAATTKGENAKPKAMMINDVKRAYFYAEVEKPL